MNRDEYRITKRVSELTMSSNAKSAEKVHLAARRRAYTVRESQELTGTR